MLAEFTPYAIFGLGIINGLLTLVYLHMRDQINDLKEQQIRQQVAFDKFKDEEIKAVNAKLDDMRIALTNQIHMLELALVGATGVKLPPPPAK